MKRFLNDRVIIIYSTVESILTDDDDDDEGGHALLPPPGLKKYNILFTTCFVKMEESTYWHYILMLELFCSLTILSRA